MKIVIYSPAFLPKVGGLENMVHYIAEAFTDIGVDVSVFTLTSTDFVDTFPYKVYRNSSVVQLYNSFSSADAYLMFNVSLKGIWPVLFNYRKVLVSHQITYFNLNGSLAFKERIKRHVASRIHNISCSAFVNQTLLRGGKVIPNAYQDNAFFELNIQRNKDLVFVGRLVSDKGVETLLEALSILHKSGLRLRLTVVGDGPDSPRLNMIIRQHSLERYVLMVGSKTSGELNQILNEHKVMVVPSLWKEPFGIVALEGLAAGCHLIVSKYGGLKEAVNGFGQVFTNGSEQELAQAIENYYKEPEQFSVDKQLLVNHLQRHTKNEVARQYLNQIEKQISKKSSYS